MQLRELIRQPGAAANDRLSAVGSLLLACIAVQLVFWLVINPLLFASAKRFELIPVHSAMLATLPSPDPASFERAQFRPIDLPTSDCCGPGYRLVRMQFTLASVPRDGLALLPTLGSDNFHIRVNGQWTRQEGRLELANPSYHGNRKTIHYISPGILKAGNNRLEFIAMRVGIPYFDVGKPMLAPYAMASKALAHRNFILNDYQVLSWSFGLLSSALALLLLWRSEQKRFGLSVFVLLAAWSLRTHYYQWTDPPFSPGMRMFYYFALTTTIPVAWVCFVDAWTGRPWRWLGWAAGLVWAGLILSHLDLLGGGAAAYDRAAMLTNSPGMVLGALGVLRFIWHFARHRDERHWETALLLLCISVMSVDFVRQQFFDKSSNFLVTGLPILILAFPVAFIARNIRLFRSMNEFNELLTGQLREREAELAENYARQAELARRETLVNERQRLMRDMHDGIGGQLMSLLFAARKQPIPQAELAEDLQQVIDELRLIIDSLDTEGETLGTALATFRARIEPRLSAAGIELRWDNSLTESLYGLGPREVLQIFRIVQEAVTNVIKHSGSSTLAISIAQADDATPQISITIADAGNGGGARPGTGRGMDNMRARARSIGGSLLIESTPSGTRLVLLVPAQVEGSTP